MSRTALAVRLPPLARFRPYAIVKFRGAWAPLHPHYTLNVQVCKGVTNPLSVGETPSRTESLRSARRSVPYLVALTGVSEVQLLAVRRNRR